MSGGSKTDAFRQWLRESLRRVLDERSRMQVPELVEAEDKQVPVSLNEVLGVAELREMIIKKASYEKDESGQQVVCRDKVKILRQLNKEWMSSVTKVLEVDKEPLFLLTLDKYNSWSASPMVVRENGKLLDRFVECMRSPLHLDCPPTFILKIMEEFFRSENHDSLRNCLLECGKSMLEMEIFIPENGGSLACVFPPFSLPVLRKLTANFRDHGDVAGARLSQGEDPLDMLLLNRSNLTNLLNSVFSASSVLTQFSVPIESEWGLRPANFHLINLPPTLTKLELCCEVGPLEVEILTRNELPNLTNLKMRFMETHFADGLIYSALDKFRRNLKHLTIYGVRYDNTDLSLITLVKFPVMEKLEALTFAGATIHLEVEPDVVQNLFPKMKKLQLLQTEAGFRTWTQLTFPEVRQLELQLIEVNLGLLRLEGMKVEYMQLVQRSFPNVTELSLTASASHTEGLKYVFMEMKQLKSLHLKIGKCQFFGTPDFWDALFTGTTMELMAGLRPSREFWDRIDFGNENMPNIRMLRELTTLTLDQFHFPGQAQLIDYRLPLISDLAFIHGFLKMPKLQNLELHGRFMASPEIRKRWEDDHRKISYVIKTSVG